MEVMVRQRPTQGEDGAGFTLLETMIAMSVLMVGLVGVLGLFSASVGNVYGSQADLIAKQKARQALESIFTARNTQQVSFDMVSNTSAGGIFLDGWQSLKVPGADGLVDTADDGGLEAVTLPGADGMLGTGDDTSVPLSQFQRQILIQPATRTDGSADPNLRRVTVTITYPTSNGTTRTYAVTTYVSRYR